MVKGWLQQRSILIIKWIGWIVYWTPVRIFIQPPVITQWAYEQWAIMAGMEAKQGLCNIDFHSQKLAWLQPPLISQSPNSRDQAGTPDNASFLGVTNQLTGWSPQGRYINPTNILGLLHQWYFYAPSSMEHLDVSPLWWRISCTGTILKSRKSPSARWAYLGSGGNIFLIKYITLVHWWNDSFEWNPEQEKCLQQVQDAVQTALPLGHRSQQIQWCLTSVVFEVLVAGRDSVWSLW